ncbi:peptidase domain-containing ABC transporter [Pedobacter sp. MR2016-24]|uniref:peptidase domain-containing ABC transporter n=1 Tax=Pedobacter sp. MR2016-24 TaxID=2994466 RepID=UPI002247E1CF|nr:peptidase domain-containing ABC transporter [Pedobacter sp. MR2016-24]MCX2485016.1 peptidase domain-containing ABC transporter [Pedobacter sp. MR2016-24]
MSFPNYHQFDQMDCGPTCLRIIAKYYGKNFSLERLRNISGINREGVSLLGISEAAEKIGFRTTGLKLGISEIVKIDLPCVLHWRNNHFVVLYKISKRSDRNKRTFYISDPDKGLLKYTQVEFSKCWRNNFTYNNEEGIVLSLSPGPEFYAENEDDSKEMEFSYLFSYLFKYKKLLIQLILSLGVGSVLQLILPFLTQSIVDVGINTRSLNFIYIILIAQTMLLFGRMSVDFIRSWILLHITTRLNISILTDFLIKLMKLPVSFFDTKMTGDIMQRMTDQSRIQNFLTGSSLITIFSLSNLLIFGFVLAYYNATVFIIFLASTGLYMSWIFIFLRKRREIDFRRFDVASENQSSIVELINGMQEIKLNNCERQKRWEWERIQASLFKFNVKSLALGQYQQFGTFFINEGKNILITFIVAKLVIDGELTLGAMMAIQYIVGQLNSPIEQLLGFLQQFQDAKISLERLNEIHKLKDEEPAYGKFIQELPFEKHITLQNINFSYPGAGNDSVLRNINLHIPEGKTTAIVGMSGSGKTTILKLLLRFYDPQKGEIKIGSTQLNQIGYRYWRSKCGIVMQDGFIFSDTIAKNIAVGDEYPNMSKLYNAIKVANIHDYINELPQGLGTKIGSSGNGISQGQRQRILIARAVYKNPDFMFFDEATNSLDANNEKVIMENLTSFFKGRTVVVVAHRLSTVRNADNIIVLDKGEIIEHGPHQQLVTANGVYYNLVKNQLELGS